MREITPEDAARLHGISTSHHQMPNGELRFRLRKSDGTAYIRTEATSEGAWQSSHYHNRVRETYIVQKGWIAYAELIDGKRRLSSFQAGELFTTQPSVIHNVYMPGNAVIHTVKHGEASNEDRIEDYATSQFNLVTQCLTEDQIHREADTTAHGISIAESSETYRHFDNLIWQLPAWCTAIFMVTVVGTNSLSDTNVLVKASGLPSSSVVTGFLFLMFFLILALTHALYKFRRHQAAFKYYPPTPVWSSASTHLQLIVTVEAFSLLFMLLLLNGIPFLYALLGCSVVVAGITWYRELMLRR
ncbi:MAG: hypothetical protein O8C62_06570 [Candidatus Methanoperedens sp.]|nr:hypothetical protein [Candidatus Methanoperedens sp.]